MSGGGKVGWSERLLAALALALASGTPTHAQDGLFARLQGHSITVNYAEVLTFPNGFSFQRSITERIYISTKGRIFQKTLVDSTAPRDNRQSETFGEATGGGRNFTWTGSGLFRRGRRPNGVVFTETIPVTPTAGGGFSCRYILERFGSRAAVSGQRHSCRVSRGNLFGGAQS